MNRLSVSFWLVALLGATVLAALWFRAGRQLRETATELATARRDAAGLRAQLTAAAEAKSALDQRVAGLESELTQARTELAAVTGRNQQLTQDAARAGAELKAANAMQQAMQQHIAGLERELAATRAALVPAETIEGYRATIADLERQLAATHAGAAVPGTAGASTAVFSTRAPVTAQVLSVGPGNSFVVLDYGGDRGAAVGQRLAIRRGTDPLAEVLISEVRNLLSIAQVRPDSLRGVLHKGDSAVLTN